MGAGGRVYVDVPVNSGQEVSMNLFSFGRSDQGSVKIDDISQDTTEFIMLIHIFSTHVGHRVLRVLFTVKTRKRRGKVLSHTNEGLGRNPEDYILFLPVQKVSTLKLTQNN